MVREDEAAHEEREEMSVKAVCPKCKGIAKSYGYVNGKGAFSCGDCGWHFRCDPSAWGVLEKPKNDVKIEIVQRSEK